MMNRDELTVFLHPFPTEALFYNLFFSLPWKGKKRGEKKKTWNGLFIDWIFFLVLLGSWSELNNIINRDGLTLTFFFHLLFSTSLFSC